MLRDETIRRVIQFRDDREWRQFHTPKDLAISLSLEAAELLEIFQWSGANLECRDKLGRIREELADVLSYCVLMAGSRPLRALPHGAVFPHRQLFSGTHKFPRRILEDTMVNATFHPISSVV